MKNRKKVYEGKAKILYKGPDPDTLIQYFKDDTTAFNNKKKSMIPGKGVLNNFISELIMTRLNDINIPNHFLKRLNMREQLVKKLEIIPIELVVRNIATGSLVKRLGIEEGKVLNRPIVEFYLKNDELNDPIITEEHIIVFEWATPNELEEMISLSSRINDFLTGYFFSLNIRLVDFKLEFGRNWRNDEASIILADEISPDNCRLWDLKTNRKLDKDRFRQDLGDVDKAYKEVAYRLGVLSENEFKKVIKNDL
ncbi:MAG: phosphoribosylaminoimidazolesuccinocarboxamide synthase [Alphaproteobacteria bacterium]